MFKSVSFENAYFYYFYFTNGEVEVICDATQ